MRSNSLRLLLICLTLVLGLVASPPLASSEMSIEIRQRLQPVYENLQEDPQFQRLSRELSANLDNDAVVDRFLEYLPISPVEYMRLNMWTLRYEHVIPAFVLEWDKRWLEIHEVEARALYGDEYVDARLGPVEEPAPGDAAQLTELLTAVGPNRNAAATEAVPPDRYQGEIQIAVNPYDPQQIVAGANTLHFDNPLCVGPTQAIFHSSDGGDTWGYTCAPGVQAYGLVCDGRQIGSDPAVVWNHEGTVFLEYLLICTDFVNFQYSIVIAASEDGGATWDARGIVTDSFDEPNSFDDKEFLAVDTYETSPYQGRLYSCWHHNNDATSAYSTDNGATWTEVDLPVTPSFGNGVPTDIGCDMTVAKDGTVHIIYNTIACPTVICEDEQMFHSFSTDGGASWSSPTLVRDFNLVGFSVGSCPEAQDFRCISAFGAIGIDNSGGACDGTLYVTYGDFTGTTAEESDIFLTRSLDGGATWEDSIRVNDDGAGGNIQFHPFLAVEPASGAISIAWHDARNDPNNRAVDYFLARSMDCGQSVGPNVQVSQPSDEFNSSGVSASNVSSADNPGRNPNQYGEYLGVDILGGKVYMAWGDSRHYFPDAPNDPQRENLAFAVVDFGDPEEVHLTSIGAHDGWIREQRETSETGGLTRSFGFSSTAIRVGDASADRQLRSVLSFDTSGIPDDAIVLSAELRLVRGGVRGDNPFTSGFGDLKVDVKSGSFGSPLLESSDFEAAATVSGAAVMSPVGNRGLVSVGVLDPVGRAAINRTGLTQLRLAFELDDDDDRRNDYVGFFSGEFLFPWLRPQLVVTYQP